MCPVNKNLRLIYFSKIYSCDKCIMGRICLLGIPACSWIDEGNSLEDHPLYQPFGCPSAKLP